MIYKYNNREFDIDIEAYKESATFLRFNVFVDSQPLGSIVLDRYTAIESQAEDFAIRLDILLDDLI